MPEYVMKIFHPRDLDIREKVQHLKAIAKSKNHEPQGYAIGFTAVAYIGYGNDWSAYWLRTGAEGEEVMAHGDKIPRDLAEAMFPWFKAAGYEYRD